MYRIVRDGAVIAYVEQPYYIRLHTNGCFVKTTEEKAQGIAIQSVPYHLLGKEDLPGAVATVGISEVDGGIVLVNQQDSINELIQTVLEG